MNFGVIQGLRPISKNRKYMIRRIVFAFTLFFCFSHAYSQSPGDTLEIETFNYTQTYGVNQWSPGIRDTMIDFPDLPGVTYEKILMTYNMRCKDGLVSNSSPGNRDRGCGEWDISCNTYITDSTLVDSLARKHPDHTISGFSGTSYNYVSSPLNDYYQVLQQAVSINSVVSETSHTIGTGTLDQLQTFPGQTQNSKSQYLFLASELSTSGLTAGSIDAISIETDNASGNIQHLRIRIKESSKTTLNASDPDLGGFSEVYFHDLALSNGVNKIPFHTPFNWNGSSNLIVEFTYSGAGNPAGIVLDGNSTTGDMGLSSKNDQHFHFDGSNYIEADNYKGISGNGDRTVEAWIKTSVSDPEIVGWGLNASSQKWTFRINGDGTIRAEVNGGFIFGTTAVDDDQWHHVAVVFSGTNINQALLYVDGNLEVVGGSQGHTVNTASSLNLRITRGANNTYFEGIIDEVRVWSSALNQSTLQDWMHRDIDPNHPNYANLEVYYPLDGGSVIMDHSPNGRNASIINGPKWRPARGIDHFKNMVNLQERPNAIFHRGNYNLTVSNDTVVDTLQRFANTVTQYQVFPKYGTMEHDSIGAISTNSYWEAIDENLYDPSGALLNSITVNATGNITVAQLDYFQRYPSKFEIMSFVTPYGLGLNLGQKGKTWTFDVTDYAPILKGRKRMTIERGGQWMEDMDIRFHYIVGTPPRDVHSIQQLWRVEKKGYQVIQNEESFEARDVMMSSGSVGFKIRSVVTGHGQQGEFIPRWHYINLDGGSNDFQYQVWQECGDNPIFPQGGTWIYDRAGWCPGMPSTLFEFDITPLVTPGQSSNIDYGVLSASGASNYIVNNQLVSYGAANFITDAALVDVKNPTNRVEYSRKNPACIDPIVVIRNTGSDTLTSLDIKYWVNDSTHSSTFNWTGTIPFMAEESISLPTTLIWQGMNVGNNIFHAEISNPNGSNDEYAFNNHIQTNFEAPKVLPGKIMIVFKTNNVPWESSYELLDDQGTVITSSGSMAANTTYFDTLDLNDGCYTLKVKDSDDDGLSFWANNDGSGYVAIRSHTGQTLQSFNPDFGKSIIYHFNTDALLYNQLRENTTDIQVYPNPSSGSFMINGLKTLPESISLFDQSGREYLIKPEVADGDLRIDTQGYAPGIYIIRLESQGIPIFKKVVIQ